MTDIDERERTAQTELDARGRCVPVSDVDRAKTFYAEQLGFVIDHDTVQGEDVRVVQLTRPGRAARSSSAEERFMDMPPGSLQGLQLVVPDIRAAHAELVGRGVDVTDVQVYGPDGLRPSRDGDALDNVGSSSSATPMETVGRYSRSVHVQAGRRRVPRAPDVEGCRGHPHAGIDHLVLCSRPRCSSRHHGRGQLIDRST